MTDDIEYKATTQAEGTTKAHDTTTSSHDATKDIAPGTTEETGSRLKRLDWKRLAVCLIVDSVALGALSMPSVFSRLGMVAGVLVSVALGLVAVYTGFVVGRVAIRYPSVGSYADAVRLIWGRTGYELTSVMLVLLLGLTTASHVLTGTISLIRITDDTRTCALVWGVVSAIVLYLLALPPTFAEFAFLGYIDFASVVSAVLITMVSTGVQAHADSGRPWSLWPPEDVDFRTAFGASTNVIFAYSFAVAQFSFMAEMQRPHDYKKAIAALGVIEIVIYTSTGAIIYAFVGTDVQSPALLSAGKTISRITFGVAIPVIFISGSINTVIAARHILDRYWARSDVRLVNTRPGWVVWAGLVAAITVLAFIMAEAVPFFNDLLGVMASLFISGFSYYFPALFWFFLLKEGKWYSTWSNMGLTLWNGLVFCVGIMLLVCGTYANVQSIVDHYRHDDVGTSFTCSAAQYL